MTAFLQGGGRMAEMIETFDWSATALGPIRDWPAVAKIAVSTMLNSAFPKCLCWGDDLTMLYNDAFVAILGGKHPCLGRPFLEVWEETAHSIAPIAQKALAGESTFIEDFEILTSRSGQMDSAFFTFCYSPIRDETGIVRGMLNTVMETTGKVRSQRLATLRNRELVHRSRNAYALVSALVNQTFRSRDALTDIQSELQNRISALVRAQDVLMETGAVHSDIDTVVRRALTPFLDESRQITMAGPAIEIGREQVTTLSLALHELATNAIKYGALGQPEGTVTLEWQIDGDHFKLLWQERGGPLTTTPDREGFGSSIIGFALPQAFNGTVEMEYAPEGLTVTLRTDARRLIADDQPGAEESLCETSAR